MEKEEIKKPVEDVEKPVSIVDEARAIRDDIKKERETLAEERKKLEDARAEEMLSSTAGRRVEQPKMSPEDEKTQGAAEFFKGTQLEKDIKKANKKDE